MSQNQCCRHLPFQLLKCFLALIIKVKGDICLYKLYKRPGYDFIVLNKLLIKVIKAKEGLHAFYYTRLFPVINNLDLVLVNLYTLSANNKAQVLYIIYSKFIFLNVSLQACFLELYKDLLYMLLVLQLIIRVDQNIIKVSRVEDV